MLTHTEEMYREDRLETEWGILDMIKPEGLILIDWHSIYWIALKSEPQRWVSFIDARYGRRGLVQHLIEANLIGAVPDPEDRGQLCFELSDLGRRTHNENNRHCWETRAAILDGLAAAH